jgi:hypothetical protein
MRGWGEGNTGTGEGRGRVEKKLEANHSDAEEHDQSDGV